MGACCSNAMLGRHTGYMVSRSILMSAPLCCRPSLIVTSSGACLRWDVLPRSVCVPLSFGASGRPRRGRTGLAGNGLG